MTINHLPPVLDTANNFNAEALASNISALVSKRNVKELRTLSKTWQAADIAEALRFLEHDELLKFVRWVKMADIAEIFSFLDHDLQGYIISSFSNLETSFILEELNINDIVDVIDEMPASLSKKILRVASPDVRDKINQLLQYPEDSAGSIMSVDFLELKTFWTVKQAIEFLRKSQEDFEVSELFYVIDEKRNLIGYVNLKDLFFANASKKVETICSTKFVYALTTDDQEEVAQKLSKYDLELIPIINTDHKYVGVITAESALDIVTQEATEDIQLQAGMAPSEESYFKTSVLKMVRARSLWLLLLMISATVSQVVISQFMVLYKVNASAATSANNSITYVVTALLVPLLPLVSGTSGNAGSQSSTMIVRALSLKEVAVKQYVLVLWKELRVAFLTGIILVIVNFVRMIIVYYIEKPHSINFNQWRAIAVLSIALYLTLILAKLVGSMLPILAKSVKLDPAIMAAPLLTTLVDALSTAVFFSIGALFFLL